MWNLGVSLPLMIRDLILHADEEWECFLLLLEVLQICVSPVISADLVAYLTMLIEMYLSAFRKCYPAKNIIPKQHFMTHFPSQTLYAPTHSLNLQLLLYHVSYSVHKEICMYVYTRLGPLTMSWCMHMEANFKRIAQQGNFKYISLSVSRCHQKLMCAFVNSGNFLQSLNAIIH